MSLDVQLIEPNTIYEEHELYWGNITHNLNKMAIEAGIYKAIWKPEEISAVYAKDIIDILIKGLEDLRNRKSYYEQFDSPNKWGVYEDFVRFVTDYLGACIKYPKSKIVVDR